MSTHGREARLSVDLRLTPTRYEPVARIAVGGMADVWRANALLEDGTSYPVAVKRVLPTLAKQPQFRRMFEDEARLGMLLRHANIVRVFDARAVGDSLIMVMEFVDGAPLKALADHAEARGVGFPLAAALHIMRELCAALAHAHQAVDREGRPLGVVHRDVSPHNVLLGRNGAVKLADFGLAVSASNAAPQAEGMVGGKLGYLAPELLSEHPTTVSVDVFAAGVVLWELVAGRRLFARTTDEETVRAVARCEVPPPSRLFPALPSALDAILARALHPDPAQRYPDARTFGNAIDALATAIDHEVGPKDVGLLVGLFLAGERVRSVAAVPDVAGLLAAELERFVLEADARPDPGAAPLDPMDFPTQRARR
jgi:serine/threonine protein kinase